MTIAVNRPVAAAQMSAMPVSTANALKINMPLQYRVAVGGESPFD